MGAFKTNDMGCMSLDVDGFTNDLEGGDVLIAIDSNHRLLKLARLLPWDGMLEAVLPDLQLTERACWWMGRPLRVRIHLGVYILQQMFNCLFTCLCCRNNTNFT